jgi:hypothetical protein
MDNRTGNVVACVASSLDLSYRCERNYRDRVSILRSTLVHNKHID